MNTTTNHWVLTDRTGNVLPAKYEHQYQAERARWTLDDGMEYFPVLQSTLDHMAAQVNEACLQCHAPAGRHATCRIDADRQPIPQRDIYGPRDAVGVADAYFCADCYRPYRGLTTRDKALTQFTYTEVYVP